ncbi:RdgB/HAM1 family non-canonical purine NTP pyrophosphatase [Lewinella sp. 4G2]|uniref:RdgB/HAM1 family non-canonical purine NTP pyrophosphatase n=1 Tax=Lewinella sp. 4G2 TaxID=1803372 RepID=UPI0007B48D1C|nr:RdgB/HAM1 family non-canonical purine NTP pyrophosphatase [Lewinella sp. 4G2]OAV42621.1 non-canonical purine NTP pyrophosphatase, RdgB/HAM1 family [Lewinella sp. 4G2]
MPLVFATNNPNKIAEIQNQLSEGYDFKSLKEIGCLEEIPETSGTIEGNARQKARYVKDNYGYDCFSEDTGLLIDALDDAPGVDTAHYAGPQRDATDNNQKVLQNLEDKAQRTARFKTVICLVRGDEEHFFEGICEGHIAAIPTGEDGFGYDPIFIPTEGDGRTFAQMNKTEKQAISHRGRAVRKLVEFLK